MPTRRPASRYVRTYVRTYKSLESSYVRKELYKVRTYVLGTRLHPLGGAMNYLRTYVRNPVWRLLARFCLQHSYTYPESRAIRADRGDACQPTASPHSHVAPLKADLLHSTYVRTSSDGLPTYVRTYVHAVIPDGAGCIQGSFGMLRGCSTVTVWGYLSQAGYVRTKTGCGATCQSVDML